MPDNSSLYDPHGIRKYVNALERNEFLVCAARQNAAVRTLAETLLYSGCRISEALNLTVGNVDLDHQLVKFETLKKRTRGQWRAVPVPAVLIEHLDLAHALRQRQFKQHLDAKLWNFSRITAWRYIKRILAEANIHGPQATPKGLRHGFGVAAVQSGAPLHLVARWLGHSSTNSTVIYTQAVGQEERTIANRIFN